MIHVPYKYVYKSGVWLFLAIVFPFPSSEESFKMFWKELSVGILLGTVTEVAIILSGYKILLLSTPHFIVLVHLFTLLIFTFIRNVILYPKLFSSMRHLPRPSVSQNLHLSNAWPEFPNWLARAAPFSMGNSMRSAKTCREISSGDG